MSELIAQLGTLIGVVVGVVATFFATTLMRDHNGIGSSWPE